MTINPVAIQRYGSVPARILLLHNTPALGFKMMATPMLRALRRNYPDAEIFVATNKNGASFYANNSLGIKAIDVDSTTFFPAMSLVKMGLCIAPYGQEFLYLDLVTGGSAFGRTIGENFRIRLISELLSSEEQKAALFTDNAEVFMGRSDPICPGEYMGKLYLRYLEPLGIYETDAKPQIWTSDAEAKRISDVLSSAGFGGQDFIVGINIGGRNHRWPVEKIAKFLPHFDQYRDNRTNEALKGRKIKYAVTYDWHEAVLWEKLQNYSREFENRLIGIETPSPGLLAAAISKFSYFVTTETGSAHVAQALDIPSTVLYPSEQWMKSWLLPGARVMPVVSTDHSVERLLPENVNIATCNGISQWIK